MFVKSTMLKHNLVEQKSGEKKIKIIFAQFLFFNDVIFIFHINSFIIYSSYV